VDDVSKVFCRNFKKSLWYGAQDVARELFCRRGERDSLRADEFWAVKNVSVRIRRGECIGLIGRNGAGKTTLLRMLNGLIKPDAGRITLRGRIAALIALGAGFNPVLTGRENIRINAAILGINRSEIAHKVDEIVEFAEIQDSIDAPVQTYSSGMRVRLGFAVATAIAKPDVLLLDEVLAVGDRPFRVKCYNVIEQLTRDSAVVLVSHSMPDIERVCSSVVLFDKGRIAFSGDTSEGIERYNATTTDSEAFIKCADGYALHEFEISPGTIAHRDALSFQARFTAPIAQEGAIARVLLLDNTDSVVAEWRSTNHDKRYSIQPGRNVISERIEGVSLRSGRYHVNFVLASSSGFDYLIGAHHQSVVEVNRQTTGNVPHQL
jgi:lipopolysaccharide transport system ATP-binding protein